jgi:hypothetical protein
LGSSGLVTTAVDGVSEEVRSETGGKTERQQVCTGIARRRDLVRHSLSTVAGVRARAGDRPSTLVDTSGVSDTSDLEHTLLARDLPPARPHPHAHLNAFHERPSALQQILPSGRNLRARDCNTVVGRKLRILLLRNEPPSSSSVNCRRNARHHEQPRCGMSPSFRALQTRGTEQGEQNAVWTGSSKNRQRRRSCLQAILHVAERLADRAPFDQHSATECRQANLLDTGSGQRRPLQASCSEARHTRRRSAQRRASLLVSWTCRPLLLAASSLSPFNLPSHA